MEVGDGRLAAAGGGSAAGGAALRGAAAAPQGPYGAQPRLPRRPHRVQQVLLAPLPQRDPAPPRQAVLALCRIAGLADADAERFAVRWELAVKAWPRPAKPAGEESEPEYEDDPTLPWWDAPEEASGRRPGAWPLLYAALLLLLMLLVLAVGAVLLG